LLLAVTTAVGGLGVARAAADATISSEWLVGAPLE
jgi:hypothetical protein